MLLANRIKQIREAHSLTQLEVAAKINISASAYGQIERRAGSSSFDTLQKIADAIGVTLPFLVDIKNSCFKE